MHFQNLVATMGLTTKWKNWLVELTQHKPTSPVGGSVGNASTTSVRLAPFSSEAFNATWFHMTNPARTLEKDVKVAKLNHFMLYVAKLQHTIKSNVASLKKNNEVFFFI